MFQFSISRMLLITVGIALLTAALREETGLSAIRLTAGSVAAFALPSLLLAFLELIRINRLRKIGPVPTDRISLVWVLLLVGGILSILSLFAMSSAYEAFEFTSGLTRWIIPIALMNGVLFAANQHWKARREKQVQNQPTDDPYQQSLEELAQHDDATH